MNARRHFNSCVPSLALLGPLLLLVLATGCTTVVRNPKAAFAGYAPSTPIDLKVGLHVTTELRKPEFNKDGLIIRPGDYLATNCLLLTRHVFREVLMTTNAESAGMDALLTPKLVYVNRTRGATSFGESITSLKVEWTLRDPAGKPVWLETITGEGKGSTGWTAPEKPLKTALDELLLKSQQAMSGAQTIRAFSSQRK